jgi:hypothetical protein
VHVFGGFAHSFGPLKLIDFYSPEVSVHAFAVDLPNDLAKFLLSSSVFIVN